MNSERVSLIVRPDGTALDPSTDLLWMIPFVGQGWLDGLPAGEVASMSWSEATSRYGRARNIAATGLDYCWMGQRAETYRLTRQSYDGYQPGSKRWDFAGASDWRLPTIEELWALSLTGFVDTPLDADLENRGRRQMWTANPSTDSLAGFFFALTGMGRCAWMFSLHPAEGSSDGFGDMNQGRQYPIRLVRGGNLWRALEAT